MSGRCQCNEIKSLVIISIIDLGKICVSPTVAFLLRFGVIASMLLFLVARQQKIAG